MAISSKRLYVILTFCFLVFGLPWGLPCLHAVTPLPNLLPIHEAFVPKFSDPLPLTIIAKDPPPPLNETIAPHILYEDGIWIPGYWAYLDEANDFAWICGVWRRPPPGQYWISGSWEHSNQGWIWARGFWSPLPLEQLQYIAKAPPASISDNIPLSPGSSYFWAPGYWNYSAGTQNYSWLTGKWEPSNPDWILAPATYIWRPNGFIFVPAYWDLPLEERGSAYSCQGDEPYAIIEIPLLIERLFFCYPDYVTFYWHWWHFHPHWVWEGCGCVPPWWVWHDWWFFSWSDSWGLWWWWSHPGEFAPIWLSLELSLEIAPPPLPIIDAFKKLSKPKFDLKLGDKPLLPKGTFGKKDLSFPHIPNDITPGGKITLPEQPKPQMTIPPPPHGRAQTPQKPQEEYREDTPQIDYYEEVPQVEYYPTDNYIPPIRYPSGRPNYPRPRPHRDWDGDRDHGKGDRNPDRDHGKGTKNPDHNRDYGDGSKTYPKTQNTYPSATQPKEDTRIRDRRKDNNFQQRSNQKEIQSERLQRRENRQKLKTNVNQDS